MKNIFVCLLLTGLVICLVFSGCKNAAAPGPTTTAPAATSQTKTSPAAAGPTEIVLGLVAPVTGNLAGFGQGGVFGMQASVDDINAQGGVMVKELNRKLPVKLIVRDDLSDYIKAGTLAEELILRDKVNFLVFSGNSPPAFASIATISSKYSMIFEGNMGPYEPYLGMRSQAKPTWKYAWATGFYIAMPAPPGDFRAGKKGYSVMDASATLINQLGAQTNKRIALFASDEPDGRGWYTSMPAGLKSLGLDVLGADKELGMAPPDTKDFSSIIKQWKDYNCEILFGNAISPWFGTLLRQSREMGFKPKLIYAGRAACYYIDVNAWGGDLPNGVCCEQFWSSSYDPKSCPGIGTTTSKSLTERWASAMNQPPNQITGFAYASGQILFDAIDRAGSLDKDKVNAALAKTDLKTMCSRATFDETQFCQFPVTFGQWQKTDKPYKWEWQTVVSDLDFVPTTAKPLFPIPY